MEVENHAVAGHRGARRVGGGAHTPQDGRSFVEPHAIWVPTSIAPSNLLVYRGTGFTECRQEALRMATVSADA